MHLFDGIGEVVDGVSDSVELPSPGGDESI